MSFYAFAASYCANYSPRGPKQFRVSGKLADLRYSVKVYTVVYNIRLRFVKNLTSCGHDDQKSHFGALELVKKLAELSLRIAWEAEVGCACAATLARTMSRQLGTNRAEHSTTHSMTLFPMFALPHTCNIGGCGSAHRFERWTHSSGSLTRGLLTVSYTSSVSLFLSIFPNVHTDCGRCADVNCCRQATCESPHKNVESNFARNCVVERVNESVASTVR